MGRKFWTLFLAQGVYVTSNVVLLSMAALAGLGLAPSPRWATVPAASAILGSALSTGIVARLHRRFGRRFGFQVGLGLGVFGFGLCAWAVTQQSFAMLILGSLLTGIHGASGSLFRFASVELVEAPLRERALSLVLVGGLLGAVAGPSLAEHTRDLFSLRYTGAYAALAVLALALLALVSSIAFPDLGDSAPPQGRSVRELARQPLFLLAILGGGLSYGVMTLVMTATPIAMQQCQLPFHEGAQVLEWHILAMFTPGLFSGRLIHRFGAKRIMVVGLLLYLVCAALALDGVSLMHFGSALVALGLGWNFVYTGASALLLTTYEPHEKNRAQAAMDLCTFGGMTMASLSAGILVTGPGWGVLNRVALLPLGILALLIIWASGPADKGPAPQPRLS